MIKSSVKNFLKCYPSKLYDNADINVTQSVSLNSYEIMNSDLYTHTKKKCDRASYDTLSH